MRAPPVGIAGGARCVLERSSEMRDEGLLLRWTADHNAALTKDHVAPIPAVRGHLMEPPESTLSAIRLPHSITSSTRDRNDSGIVSPSALAVLRLTTSWNLVGCWTGRSAGLAPFRILST